MLIFNEEPLMIVMCSMIIWGKFTMPEA